MLQEYKTKTNIGIGVGFLCSIVGRVLAHGGSEFGIIIGLVFIIAGIILFIWGCISYARGKGQSPFFGLLGLLYILGLIILVFLPDKHKAAK